MGQDRKRPPATKPKRVVIEPDNFVAFSLLALRLNRPLQDLINESLTRERLRLGLPLEIPAPSLATSKR